MTHTTGPWHTPDEEAVIFAGRPNNRLIAAAPAMLAMLQRLTHPMADDDDLLDALDLIRRVTGEA